MSSHRPDKRTPEAGRTSGGSLRFWLIGAAVVLVGCAVAGVVALWPKTTRFYTDGEAIKQDVEFARIRDILWRPPVRLDDGIPGGVDRYEPRISADGQTLYFVRGKAGENADIFTCRRTLDGWTEPEPLVGVNSEYDDLGPEPSADGRSLYFYSDRPGGLGGYDLWVVHRGADGRSGFSEPVNLGVRVNSEFNDYGPALTRDGSMLYFSSNRPAPDDADQPDPDAWPGTLREDFHHRTYDLYVTRMTESGLSPALPLREANTPFNEGAPAVSPFEDFIYFASDRPDGEGGFDLYRARRLRGEHEPPENLGSEVNTAANELDPALSMGGYALHFSSDRPAGRINPDAPNPYQVYQTTSREVFRDAETHRASLDWAAIWSAIGPNLLWALLALLLLLALLALMRDMKSRKLSLLARCLLASIAAHLLLMLLFNVWQVTASLARGLKRRGPVQVALMAPAHGQELTTQVRGSFTDVQTPSPEALSTQRRESTPVIEAEPAVAMLTVDRVKPAPQEKMDMPVDAADVTPVENREPLRLAHAAVESSVPHDQRRVELTLPTDATPAHEAESASPVVPQPRHRTVTERPAVRPDHTADRAIREVALEPTSAAAPPSETDRPVPAEVSAFQDALADARATVPVRERLAVPDRMKDAVRSSPRFDVMLPTAAPPQAKSSESQASSLDILATQRAAPQAEPRSPLTNRPVRLALRDVQPEAVPSPATADSSFVDDPKAAATEAAPAEQQRNESRALQAALPAASQAGTGVAAVPMEELALPGVEERQTGAHAEAAAVPAAKSAETTRRSLDGLLAHATNNKPSAFELPPAEAASRERKAAVESVRQRAVEAVEATPQDESTVPLTAPDVTREPVLADIGNVDLHLPTEIAPPATPYSRRSVEQRMAAVRQGGGNEATENAVRLALQWLAAHQSDDGRWDGDDFDADCGQCGDGTDIDVDVALTSLSLLCFLAADHTHVHEGPYRETVDKAINWLLPRQRQDGDLRGGETMYTHGIATIVLAEAYGMTKESRLRQPVERAVRFIERARNKRSGGWRYDPGQPGDTSVLGWQIMALKSAMMAGVDVPMEPFVAARDWLDGVSSSRAPGLYAYRPGHQPSPSMTAEGLFIQQMVGRRPEEPRMQESVAFLLRHLPDWADADQSTYYWYYATLALHHPGGKPWRTWNQTLTGQLLDRQRTVGKPAGSWDPVDKWSLVGGRIYQTALCTLMLEVYYRYLPLYLDETPDDAFGHVRGIVTNESTGAPIAGAAVRLDLQDRPPIIVATDSEGRYTLDAPQVPDFFALSVSHDDYLPGSANVEAALLAGTTLTLNFELQPIGASTVAVEAVPEVHHLGDDAFSGSINSQFQKSAEGAVFRATFELSPDHLSNAARRAELGMLAKGVQMAHRIYINGHRLDDGLEDSPRDGSFGTFATSFDAAWLEPGTNSLEIHARSRGSDVDDFEFVNLQINLSP